MHKLTWSFAPGDSLRNFGDDLNPWLYEKITGVKPVRTKLNKCAGANMMIGSILEYAKPGTIVWGTGLYSPFKVNSKAKFYACRGPLTHKVIRTHGGKCPEVYGDPAMLISKYHTDTPEVKYELGIIPHYVDYHKFKDTKFPEAIKIIDIGNPDLEEFMSEIKTCNRIISSSLHGLIAADAFRIPAKWCKFSNKVAGNDMKFHDHFASIGLDSYEALDLTSLAKLNANEIIASIDPYDVEFDEDEYLNTCPFEVIT